MADDHLAPPAQPGEDPFAAGPTDRSPTGGDPATAGDPGEPAAGGGPWPRDYDLAWTVGWQEQGRDPADEPPAAGGAPPRHPRRGGRSGPPPRPPRRRRRLTAGAFAVIVSLAALALGVTAVLNSSPGEPTETVRYIQVRPPEIVGPAPEPGALPAPPEPVVTAPAQPPVPLATEPAIELLPPGVPPPPPPGAPAPPPAAAPATPQPAPPPAPVQEPVVAAASRVEPSVVLLQTSQGQGSGIIYNAAGYVLTAAHVVEGAQPLDDLFGDGAAGGPRGPRGDDLDIDPSDGLDAPDVPGLDGGDGTEGVPDVVVQLANGVRTGGRVLAANRELDVAVVQIDPSLDLTVAQVGSLSTVEVGQTAVAVGSPFGMENVVTVGVVSALNQVLGGENVPPIGMIQTDAPINRGNSGGPLADLDGRVIGMNLFITSTIGGGNIGVGFATPIEVAIWIAEELRSGREVRFGFLGITGYTPPLGDPGAIVASVTPGGPAEAAGMEVNDRIVSFDGQPVASMDELAVAVRLRAPGSEVVVEVVRDDLLIRLFIPLGDRGESLDLEVEDDIEPEVDP